MVPIVKSSVRALKTKSLHYPFPQVYQRDTKSWRDQACLVAKVAAGFHQSLSFRD